MVNGAPVNKNPKPILLTNTPTAINTTAHLVKVDNMSGLGMPVFAAMMRTNTATIWAKNIPTIKVITPVNTLGT